jgi:hypothetical protein
MDNTSKLTFWLPLILFYTGRTHISPDWHTTNMIPLLSFSIFNWFQYTILWDIRNQVTCLSIYWSQSLYSKFLISNFYLNHLNSSSSSSIGTATLVGFGLLNYHWVFLVGRFLQSAVASNMSNPQLGGPVIRTSQLLPPGVPHVWNDASEPQQRKVELWARNGQEFCRKWRLPRHFWVLLHAVDLRHGTDGFTSPPKEGVLRIFFTKESNWRIYFSFIYSWWNRLRIHACL